MNKSITLTWLVIIALVLGCQTSNDQLLTKPRVIISSDIGGDDPDDFQSMVHFLVYADEFDIEGLISSPPSKGRVGHILQALDAYEKDYPKLASYTNEYPTPDALRQISKQGAVDIQEDSIPTELSEGAEWIIQQAKKDDPRPLYVLVWGSITDVAQALHADPSIAEKIRVYFIGSWNTRQDPKSRDYIINHHKDLWYIENNTTFRGMYMGGHMEEGYGNEDFVEQHVKGHGALGDLFYVQKKDIKMGDTPSVFYLLHGDPSDPEGESWGGAFVSWDIAPQFWTDNPDTNLIENNRQGAKTVNKWRKDYLDDWKERMDRALFYAPQAIEKGEVKALSILPLGNSITQAKEGYSSWRRLLWKQLDSIGVYSDFVGSMNQTFPCKNHAHSDFDVNHEGHWGWKANEILNGIEKEDCTGSGNLGIWLENYTPDIALIHLGSNDAFSSEPVESTILEISQIVKLLRDDNPSVAIFLATIIPAENPERHEEIKKLNAKIPSLVETLNTESAPVILVDQYEGFDAALHTFDKVHPNEEGEKLMAQKWFQAIEQYMAKKEM